MRDTRFKHGNRAAFKHGQYSRLAAAGALPEQAEALAALQANEAAIVKDLGGGEEISRVAAGQVARHCRLEMVEEFLWRNLQTHGPLTGKGRTRAALTAWLAVVDRLHRSAVTLGLRRVPKPAPSLEDYIEQLAGTDAEPDASGEAVQTSAPADGDRE